MPDQCYSGFECVDVCVDVNECLPHPEKMCKVGYCMNTEGSYICKVDCSQIDCDTGYKCDDDKNAECVDKDECADGDPCQKGDCINTIGSFVCDYNCDNAKKCAPGYECNMVDGNPSCSDKDECAAPSACEVGDCRNTEGSYICYVNCSHIDCDTGYRCDDDKIAKCIDINECADGDSCQKGDCINTIGSYTCDYNCEHKTCGPGLSCKMDENNSPNCVDINECLKKPPQCQEGVCINTNGSFKCDYNCDHKKCKPGSECAMVNDAPECSGMNVK